MSTDDLPDLWERQPKETEQAYYAFCIYRDQTTPRGYAQVVSELAKSRTLITRWASRWYWRDRTRAWDRHQEEIVRREQIKQTKAMARRQARDAQAFQAVLIAPVEAAIRKLNTPQAREQLEQMPLGDLMALSLMTARAFPLVARAERDARGAPVQDFTQFLDDDTGEITEGPSTRETYDWYRDALSALEQATGGRLALPPGAPDG